MKSKTLSHQKVRSSEFLSPFKLVIDYRTEKIRGEHVTLTCQEHHLSEKISRIDLPVLKWLNLRDSQRFASASGLPETLDMLWSEVYETYKFLTKALHIPKRGVHYYRRIALGSCTERQGKLIYDGTVYIFEFDMLYLQLIQHPYDPPSAECSGRAKTLALLKRERF